MSEFATVAKNRRLLDLGEQLVLIALYVWLCIRLLPDSFPPEQIYTTLILFSEGIVLLFLLIRRGTDKISTNPKAWFVAFAGTVTVLLIGPGGEPFWPQAGVILVFIGIVIHVGAKLSLNRSFGIVPADRGIKSNGLYRLVRHPMYFGYFISHLGFLLAAPSLRNIAVYVVAWAFLLTRILFEEKILSENPEYRRYKEKVRYRLIPGLF